MLNVVVFNGSARKTGNVEQMLAQICRGIESVAPVEIQKVNLYDYQYTGCKSCFACKKIGAPTYGKCICKDELTPFLEQAAQADILLLGSPIYFWNISGQMQALIERLLFPYHVYSNPTATLWPHKTAVGMVYAMNMTKEQFEKATPKEMTKNLLAIFKRLEPFIAAEVSYAFDTYQFSDYQQYYAPKFDPIKKAQQREQVFPSELEEAYQMGIRLAQAAAQKNAQ